MKIALGADHGGFRAKNALAESLRRQGHEVVDMGAHDETSVDYPDYAVQVAEAVARGEAERGVLVCGTGIGMSIAANKVAGVRAALVTSEDMARLASEHNNANVLVVGGRGVNSEDSAAWVTTWLSTPFEGGRHQRRLDKIAALDNRVQGKE